MTRINCGTPPAKLSVKHLLAEHREIKRLPNHLKKHGFDTAKLKRVPSEFKLGTGHVLFFLVRGKYTRLRYLELYAECIRRNLNVTYYGAAWDIYEKYPLLYNDYTPTDENRETIKQRIWSKNKTSLQGQAA